MFMTKRQSAPRNHATTLSERTAFFRERLRKWFAASAVIGVITGLSVAAIHYIVYEVLWQQLLNHVTSLWLWFLLPLIGIVISGFLVYRFSRSPSLYGTEEFVQSFHENEGRMDERSALTKIIAAIATIGLGGSAGLEGPGIQVGATVASWLHKQIAQFGFDEEDRRWMVLAGAAAGVAAVFKAPLTGIIFALEAPYRDDLAHNATIPALIASTTSYFVFVSIIGTRPLFNVPRFVAPDYRTLLYALLLGVVTGLAARGFVMLFHWIGDFYDNLIPNPYMRAVAGGAVVGLTGVASILLFSEPLSLGIGYEGIRHILAGNMGLMALIALFTLKAIATSTTLRSGGVGGTFLPLVFLGAVVGSSFGYIIRSTNIVYPIMGMAGFLAAGYNAPLAAAAFVAETTGSPGFIIPGLIAAAVSYVFSGRLGLSTQQRYGRQTVIHHMLHRTVAESMTTDVIVLDSSSTISEFVNNYVVRFRHHSFPVVDDSTLLGMVDLSDTKEVPETDWSNTSVKDIMNHEAITVFQDETLAHALDKMDQYGVKRLPVIDRKNPGKIIGLISMTDIVRIEQLSAFVQDND